MSAMGLFILSIFVAMLGTIGVWFVMKGYDGIRKNYMIHKYPILAKGFVNVCLY